MVVRVGMTMKVMSLMVKDLFDGSDSVLSCKVCAQKFGCLWHFRLCLQLLCIFHSNLGLPGQTKALSTHQAEQAEQYLVKLP